MLNDNQIHQFSSNFGIGDPVNVVMGGVEIAGHIRTITFTTSRVRYSIRIEDEETILHNIDGISVGARDAERINFGPDNYS